MDELLHHCLRELAFDGDLGCDVSRLSDFIKDFYSHSTTNQQVDEAFSAFVWSLIVQQPTVLVGTIPLDITSEVWIAPQVSAKRKANARGEEHVLTEPSALNLVPDAKSRPLADLQREYGNRLRIAGDRDSIYAAITGTHIRFPKMSPMVYSALQIITRGRVDGVTVVELGQRTRYDQKTCFYLVKQLTDLNLVVKVRRGGVGTHFVIHRYFFERSPHWKAIRDEETRAELLSRNTEASTVEGQEDEETTDVATLGFTPIDSRHLSSLPLVRGRVVKLLKASTNNMHVSNNMVVTLGFARPTKTDRRFFHRRIQELIQQGVVEKVLVPSKRKKSTVASVLCLRLVNENAGDGDGAIVVPPTTEGDQDQVEDEYAQGGFKLNVTLHKQICDLLEEAGTTGMTLTELSIALCNFDRRTIELILARAERFQPPSHLGDLGVAALLETSGRERRHRYFTISAYRTLVERENLDRSTAGYGDLDLDNVGGFLNVDMGQFYKDDEELHLYQDSFKDDDIGKTAKVKKKSTENSGANKKALSQKQKLQVGNAEVEDGGIDAQSSAETSRHGKRKAADATSVVQSESIDSRPPKKRKTNNAENAADDAETPAEPSEPLVPRKRGRPRKTVDPSAAPTAPKKRGRPPKIKATSNKDNLEKDPEEEPDDIDIVPPKKRGRRSKTLFTDVDDNHETDGLQSSSRKGVSGKSSDLAGEEQARENLARPGDIDKVDESQRHTERDVDVLAMGALINQEPVEDAGITQGEPTGPRNNVTSMLSIEPLTQESPSTITNTEQSVSTGALQALQPNTPSTSQRETPLSSKPAGQPRPKVNVSNLRRENELLRVIELLGGIVNIQTKELYEAHLALLDTLAKAGEPASSPPGIKADKRTVTATFNALESRGKVKQLSTSVPMYLGTSRQTVIVYLPHVSDVQLGAFLSDLALGIGPPPVPQPIGRVIDEAVEYGQEKKTVIRKFEPVKELEKVGISGPDRWVKDTERAEQLFSQDENLVRDVLLTERSTLCQAYHTIIAKCVRAREMHLISMEAFETLHPSLQIVSHRQKIIHLSFLSLDLPLGQYSKLVSPLSHSEELSQFMSTEAGLNTVVRNLPENIKNILQAGKSRASSKLLECLELLRSLGLASPLVPSTSDTPLLTCEIKDSHPTAFEAASLEGWNTQTSLSAPVYWKFHEAAPVHHWANAETDPPFLQDMNVSSVSLAINYWALLQNLCLSRTFEASSQEASNLAPLNISIASARTLRRPTSWISQYKFSWHQTQYLKRFYNMSFGTTPLEADDSDAQIDKISWVISAPSNAVRDYYRNIQSRLGKEAEKARKRRKREESEEQMMETAKAQASLKKKAEEAHLQRETEWTQLLERVHPEPLNKSASNRVKQIRGRFLQFSTIHDIEKWEAEIINTIHEAEMLSKKALKPKAKVKASVSAHAVSTSTSTHTLNLTTMPTIEPPTAINPPERSVIDLISDQGPPLNQTRPSKKQQKKKRKQDGPPEDSDNKPRIVNRRHRFAWNREYEELARDAAAIIKARCRDAIRLDWGAFEQVFPAVPRNTIRQRVAHLREVTGGDTYLNRLEDSWYELWKQHRGSEHLPDDDPTSGTNFDLVKHVEFLRKHIDKNALRVGYMPAQKVAQPAIPSNVSDLLAQFDVFETPQSAPSWDFVWNALVEEGRERGMLSLPFTNQLDVLPLQAESVSEEMCLAESALKMVLGTPNEVYDSEVASALLSSVGEEAVPLAAQNLLSRGVLSKLVRDPQKSQPGRLLKISEVNQNALNGVISRDTFQDAASLEEISVQQDDVWREWPLLATDGDLATLVQLVSENKAELVIDTSHPQACRPALDWNSKKADDDQIETSINFRFFGLTDSASSSSDAQEPAIAPIDVVEVPSMAHGVAVDGSTACCRKNILGAVVNCSGCLDELWKIHSANFSAEELTTAQSILWSVGQAGAKGLSKQDLILNTKITPQEILPVLSKMSKESFLYWVGYNSTLLVSAAHAGSWTVALSDSPSIRVFPRRWLDIFGKKVIDVWEAALRAVIGAIISRPGISQSELRWRLKSVYDKQEVMELLKTLLEEDYIKNRSISTTSVLGTIEPLAISALDEREEGCVFWFGNEAKHWYII
ncbi:hypothetical protein DFJ43DRAFT_382574 [Lentinula guzmanii]|uniref:Transcription factor tau subunit sfc3/Tfc3 C-terminal domain-containing protein n=1 Tax=Lentinula guzmanii TaxID=2804957 RepID=A0AA38JT80_9AGAR|nr:hypothetical protein DFJ43DRAFT_382574 [Lentinula guzmanii]